MTHDPEAYSETLRLAESAVCTKLGPGIVLSLRDVIADYEAAPNILLRCDAQHSDVSPATSVVVKHPREPKGFLRHECAAYRFLSGLEATRDLVPGLLGVDLEHEVLVLEDLGPTKQNVLGWKLLGDDRAAAESGLVAFHRSLAALHGHTCGRAIQYEALRASCGAERHSHHKIHHLIAALEKLPD